MLASQTEEEGLALLCPHSQHGMIVDPTNKRNSI